MRIARPLTPYHEHNAAQARPMLLRRLAEGAPIALVSDAGTPAHLRSRLQARSRRPGRRPRGHDTARRVGGDGGLAVAGLPTDQFLFAGFLPPKETARRARIAELARIPATLVLFESGPRLGATLADLAAGLGGQREVALCRELTKLHEEIRRGDLAALADAYADNSPRGEIVLVIAPPQALQRVSAAETETLLRQALRARFAERRRRRSGGRDRPAAARGLSARARARQGNLRTQRKANMARRAEPLKPAKPAPRPERVEAFRLGLSAESRAAMFLIAKAYRIVARRWKTPFGEIDIVARRRHTLVFVEVKARASIDDGDRSGDRTRQKPHRRRGRILARAAPR